MDAKEIKEIRDRLQLLSSLVELDPRRKVLDEVRPKRLALQESLKEEQARRLAVLKAQAPPPRDLKRVRQLKAGELTQVGAGQVLRTLMEAGLDVYECTPLQASLEEVFLEAVG